MDKKLSNANNLTLLELNTTDLKGNVTWMRELQQAEHLAVKLDAGYIVRKGMENIYGEAGGSSYGALISTSVCFGEFFACPFAVSEEAATIDRRS